MPIYFKEADVAEFVDMPSTIEALRQAFAAQARGEANIVPRTRWEFGDRRLNVMGGGERASKRYAVKAYGSSAFHILLYSEEQGLLAIIGGEPARTDPHRRCERGGDRDAWRARTPARSR